MPRSRTVSIFASPPAPAPEPPPTPPPAAPLEPSPPPPLPIGHVLRLSLVTQHQADAARALHAQARGTVRGPIRLNAPTLMALLLRLSLVAPPPLAHLQRFARKLASAAPRDAVWRQGVLEPTAVAVPELTADGLVQAVEFTLRYNARVERDTEATHEDLGSWHALLQGRGDTTVPPSVLDGVAANMGVDVRAAAGPVPAEGIALEDLIAGLRDGSPRSPVASPAAPVAPQRARRDANLFSLTDTGEADADDPFAHLEGEAAEGLGDEDGLLMQVKTFLRRSRQSTLHRPSDDNGEPIAAKTAAELASRLDALAERASNHLDHCRSRTEEFWGERAAAEAAPKRTVWTEFGTVPALRPTGRDRTTVMTRAFARREVEAATQAQLSGVADDYHTRSTMLRPRSSSRRELRIAAASAEMSSREMEATEAHLHRGLRARQQRAANRGERPQPKPEPPKTARPQSAARAGRPAAATATPHLPQPPSRPSSARRPRPASARRQRPEMAAAPPEPATLEEPVVAHLPPLPVVGEDPDGEPVPQRRVPKWRGLSQRFGAASVPGSTIPVDAGAGLGIVLL